MTSFWGELKRRNVVRVAIAYAIVSWLILQLADVLMPLLNLPEWTGRLVFLLLVIGFPLAIFFAWAFELTPDGIKREKDVDRSVSVTHVTGRKLDFIIIGILAIAVAYFVSETYFGSDDSALEAQVGTSIAVLPFVNMSADPDQEYFCVGITDEILNTLAAIEELRVTGRTSSFRFKDRTDLDFSTIGEMLGVANILEGSVRTAGNRVRITAQLIVAETGFHLWSQTYDRELTDIFAIQEEIATAIGAALQVELDLKVAQSLDRRRTDNTDAFQWYLRGEQHGNYGDLKNIKLAAAAFQKAIALDPNYVPPYVGYALAQTSLIYSGLDSVTELQQEAEQALEVVARLDPEFGRRFIALGLLYQTRNNWVAAESAYKRAHELSPEDLFVKSQWAYYLGFEAGRPEEAIELYQQYLKREPLDMVAAVNLAEMLMHAGRIVEAEAGLRRAIEIDPANAYVYGFFGNLYHYFVNRIAESLPVRRKHIDLDPEGVLIPQLLARAFLDLGDDAVAERWAQEMERIGDRSHYTIGARYFLSLYRDDEKLAASLSRQLAGMDQVNRGGWRYIPDFAWLRTLQRQDPELALRVYATLSPDLVAQEPTVGPWSHAIAISLADLYLQTGKEVLANELLNRSLSVIESTTNHYYHPAKTAIYAMKGDTTRALKELRISIDADWRWEWWLLEKEPIYETLWDEPEFKVMMDEIRADMATQLEQVRAMRRNGELAAIPVAVLAE